MRTVDFFFISFHLLPTMSTVTKGNYSLPFGKVINSFSGGNGFLSNFHICELVYNDKKYRTAEHAFQAAKCVNEIDENRIRQTPSPASAKSLGRRVNLRKDWESQKIAVMEQILRVKFQNVILRNLLIKTKSFKLVENNTWHDNEWGNCICTKRRMCQPLGKNILGKLLMKIRDEE